MPSFIAYLSILAYNAIRRFMIKKNKEENKQENKLVNIYNRTVNDSLTYLSSRLTGLNAQEVKDNVLKYGKNIISERKGKPIIIVFLKNFVSLMAILLWISGIVAFIGAMPQLGIAIWLVNIINGLFSFWQEFRANKATQALKKMLVSYVRVIRDGKEVQILSEDLVPGDIIIIAEGDKITSDARLISTNDFQVNQSTLTGESNPIRKTHEPVYAEGLANFEVPNIVFAGTCASSGSAKAVVFSTGMNTEFGKIAKLTQSMKEELSPLQLELNKLTKQISFIAFAIGVVFFLVAFLFVKDPFSQSFIFALGMIVAFIPEGLLPTVTLSLAMAVQRMSKEHALVKRLSAVETLGCTSVICSDKTGTLTQNEMTVSNLYLPNREFEVTGQGYAPIGSILENGRQVTAYDNKDLKALLVAAGLCSNAKLVSPNGETDKYTVLGDPTEACLLVAAEKANIDLEEESNLSPRIRELPFDSSRKRMSTIHQLSTSIDGCNRVAYIKGAPKEVLELCPFILIDGKINAISTEEKDKIMQENDRYARNGLRVLAVAYRLLPKDGSIPSLLSAFTPDIIEQQLIFIGLVVMSDPPRPEVAQAVEICHKANIRIIMITGDYGLTAESIAKRIGIVKGNSPRVISGSELMRIDKESLKDALKDEVIFARVAPEQKYLIVCTLQEMGEIVAVTGDGVNDAPALKKADIGVAMGISGTDVAKEAADMILTDDNFATIVRAIEEGRTVYNNIRKFIMYILNSNMSEGAPSVAFLLSRGLIPLPLTIMQILMVDLGTDMMPALGLATELPEPAVMSQPPRKKKDNLLNKRTMIISFLWYGLLASIISMGAYFFVNWLNGWPNVPLAGSGTLIYKQATTMTLASIVFCQVGMVFNCRTKNESIFKIGLFSNRRVIFGVIFEIALLSVIIYTPFFQTIFNTAPIGWADWLFLIFIPLPIIAIEELRKLIARKFFSKKGGK